MLSVSSNRRSVYEDPEALANAISHPFFDQNSVHNVLDTTEQASPAERPTSRKRYSLFARSIATPDSDRSTPSSDATRPWPRLFADRNVSQRDSVYLVGDQSAKKQARRSMVPRVAKHEAISRWMRRVERSSPLRPSTPFTSQPDADAEDKDNEHEQRKASISAPFNFQHVTHTQERELPQLDFVTDRELSLSFWASSAHQTPQSDIRGIRTASIDEAQRASRPASVLGSRPGSADPDSALNRARSPSLRDAASPVLRPSRSMSNASVQDETKRPATLSRSASLASLIAEQRSPPTMIHPAFRTAPEPVASAVPSWLIPAGIQTPTSELNRNLDVVIEEAEGSSPVKQPKNSKAAAEARQREADEEAAEPRCSASSLRSEGQETNTTSQCETSVPSLSSGETWEEDVDFCYNMEAEATCDFQWRNGRFPYNSPVDSAVASPRKYLSEAGSPFELSPRPSFTSHPANRISINMTPMLSSPEFASRWDAGAFEHPRSAPGAPDAPLPEIRRMSSLLDLPMLQPDADLTESGSSTESASAATTPGAVKRESLTSSTRSSKRDSSSRPSSRPSLHDLPSPPPTAPLPPLPTEASRKRATVSGRPSMYTPAGRPQTADDRTFQPRDIRDLKSAVPMRLRPSRSAEGPSLRDNMPRLRSSPSASQLHEAHAAPKAAEKFPIWI